MLWVKFWVDALDDPKLMSAARRGSAHLHWLPWLILFAKRADDEGALTIDGQAADPVDIARSIPNATPKRIAAALGELEKIGVLVRRSSGALEFAAWKVRAEAKPSDGKDAIAKRVRDHRDRKRKRHNAESNTGNALHSDTSSNGVTRQSESESQTQSTEQSDSERQTQSASDASDAASLAPDASLARSTRARSASPVDALPAVPENAFVLLVSNYEDDEMRADTVDREMREILGPGVRFRGQLLQSTTARLELKCGETLAELSEGRDIDDPWSYTLAKIAAPDGPQVVRPPRRGGVAQRTIENGRRALRDLP